jgi:hypothetical protein
MDNYRTIAQKLTRLEPFKGNSMWAEIGVDGSYNVYSYNTLIAAHYGHMYSISDRKYSTTTSRHQGLIRRAWA